jgi:hypothetical protein
MSESHTPGTFHILTDRETDGPHKCGLFVEGTCGRTKHDNDFPNVRAAAGRVLAIAGATPDLLDAFLWEFFPVVVQSEVTLKAKTVRAWIQSYTIEI